MNINTVFQHGAPLIPMKVAHWVQMPKRFFSLNISIAFMFLGPQSVQGLFFVFFWGHFGAAERSENTDVLSH